jgi:hypothetical protein
MPIQVSQVKTLYVDIPAVSETFADYVRLIVVKDTVMRIELCAIRLDDPNPEQTGKMYPAVRLVLPIPTAMQLHELLTQHLAELEKQGVVKRTEALLPADAKH